VNARPVGAYLIKDGELTWRPAIDVNGIVQAAAMAFVALLLTVRAVTRARARARVEAARA
jgi:NO-binding membrane sensor protein with MHYT domain